MWQPIVPSEFSAIVSEPGLFLPTTDFSDKSPQTKNLVSPTQRRKVRLCRVKSRDLAVKEVRVRLDRNRQAYRAANEIRVLLENQGVSDNLLSLKCVSVAPGDHDIIVRIGTRIAEGHSLDCFMRENTCSIAEKVCVILMIAKSLAVLHSRGWVHRDIKPENVFMGWSLIPVLADFDLSQRVGTVDWGVVGTDGYMAPELIIDVGEPRIVSVKDDVFAFGILMLTILKWTSDPVGLLFSEEDKIKGTTVYHWRRDAMMEGRWKLESVCQDLIRENEVPEELVELIRGCVGPPDARPLMASVVQELERIYSGMKKKSQDSEDDSMSDPESEPDSSDLHSSSEESEQEEMDSMRDLEEVRDTVRSLTNLEETLRATPTPVALEGLREKLMLREQLSKTAELLRSHKTLKVSPPAVVSPDMFKRGVLAALGSSFVARYEPPLAMADIRLDTHIIPVQFAVKLHPVVPIKRWSINAECSQGLCFQQKSLTVFSAENSDLHDSIYVLGLDDWVNKHVLKEFSLVVETDGECTVEAFEIFGVFVASEEL